jgi:GntR family transcriptional regulator, transcriptional repressor for pyruvate dehydrogenase complex
MASIPSLEEHLEEIEIKRPSDLILEQIRSLIREGVLKPGHRLPSERVLCDRFGVGRGHVREALRKLEFYGIVKTLPQSGTIVERIGVNALDGLISNVLGIEGGTDYKTLYEVRDVLELQAARLAAERGTAQNIDDIELAFEAHRKAVDAGGTGLDEDAMFHLKVAEASGNILMRTLISLLAPDIIKVSEAHDTCRQGRAFEAKEEHRRIVDAIKEGDSEKAAEAMACHIIESRQQHEISRRQISVADGASVLPG